MSNIWIEDDRVWLTLERLAAVLAEDGLVLDPGAFMYMATVEGPSGTPVRLFKHFDTRRYLNLDEAGHAYHYRYHRDDYELRPDLLEATAEAVGGWPFLRPPEPAGAGDVAT